jgi:hypothetical protein
LDESELEAEGEDAEESEIPEAEELSELDDETEEAEQPSENSEDLEPEDESHEGEVEEDNDLDQEFASEDSSETAQIQTPESQKTTEASEQDQLANESEEAAELESEEMPDEEESHQPVEVLSDEQEVINQEFVSSEANEIGVIGSQEYNEQALSREGSDYVHPEQERELTNEQLNQGPEREIQDAEISKEKQVEAQIDPKSDHQDFQSESAEQISQSQETTEMYAENQNLTTDKHNAINIEADPLPHIAKKTHNNTLTKKVAIATGIAGGILLGIALFL